MSREINGISESLKLLCRYVTENSYKGHDPYDGLMSPLFTLPVLSDNKIFRFGFQQLFRRIPFNLRPILRIKEGLNPVTLGLSLQAFVYLNRAYPQEAEEYNKEIEYCLDNLENLESKKYSGICWGYDFDWEARFAKIPAFTPTIVATGIITNALFEYYGLTKSERAFQMCESATDFVLNDLQRSYSDSGFCFSYSPADNQKVFNASMKGARLLAQVYSVSKNEILLNEASEAVRFVVDCQRPDGSWGYAAQDPRQWIDNHHTGYVLDCLFEYIRLTENEELKGNLIKGFHYYLNNLFDKNKLPKYYSNSIYPIDSTAVAQSIITLSRFDEIEHASHIAQWMIKTMQAPEGYFYYQKNRLLTHKTSYMRWSNAWMFLSLAYLSYRLQIPAENN